MIPDRPALSRHPAARIKGQSCCRNATPANNIARNWDNAQKGGKCLSFLLHPREGTFQIESKLAAVGYRLSLGGRRNRAGIGTVMGIVHEEIGCDANGPT